MEYIIISDTSIVAVNHSTKDNQSDNIVYHNNGKLYTIDFATCANNYQAEHSDASQYCIGERKIDEGYFIFYTSGTKTKIVFDKMYVSNFFRRHLFTGNKNIRFLDLQHYLNQTKYITLDLS